MNNKKHQWDLNVFKQDDQMVGLGCNNESYAECQAMTRLFTTLAYYSKLDIDNNKNHRDIFEHFLYDVHHAFIDDYVHFINHRSHELENIYVELESMFPNCDVSKCLFTTRHLSTDFRDKDGQYIDPLTKFYRDRINSFHFYLFHCFDVGLRTRSDEEYDREKKEDEYFDAQFARISKTIHEGRSYIIKTFSRFVNITTFVIDESEITNDEDGTPLTALDHLYEYLKNKRPNKQFSGFDAIKLNTIIQQEEYDSDAIALDTEVGNMSGFQLNDELIKDIYRFMNTQNSITFGIGVRLYYWDYYKSVPQIFDEQQKDYNINDHGGYEIANLFV
eukprot:209145_1